MIQTEQVINHLKITGSITNREATGLSDSFTEQSYIYITLKVTLYLGRGVSIP